MIRFDFCRINYASFQMSTKDISDFVKQIKPSRELAVIEDRLNHKLNYNIYDIAFSIESKV